MSAVENLSVDELLGQLTSGQSKPAPSDLRASGGAGDLMIAGDAYEGASMRLRELANWNPASRSADADIIPQKRLADARVRDTLRNDGYLRSGSNLHKDGIVGPTYMLNAKPATRVLLGKEDEKWEEDFQEEVELLFRLGMESEDNWVDASRKLNFSGLIRLYVGQYLGTGELFGTVEWEKDKDSRRPFRTSIRAVDLDRLSSPPTFAGSNQVIGGVELDSRHIPVAYHLRLAHSSDRYRTEVYQWERVPAKPNGAVTAPFTFSNLIDPTRPAASQL